MTNAATALLGREPLAPVASAVAFRRHPLLPLDDRLYAL
jgi:hypothetical protein